VETVARDGNCLFLMFAPCVAFETVKVNVRLRINTKGRFQNVHRLKMECMMVMLK
jgi:hypothetical protein